MSDEIFERDSKTMEGGMTFTIARLVKEVEDLKVINAELLEACKEMLGAFADDTKAIGAIKDGWAAIAKAEGQSLSAVVANKATEKAMTEGERDRLRAKQDKLVKLAREAGHIDGAILSIEHPGSPSIRQMETMLYPEYEGVITRVIDELQVHCFVCNMPYGNGECAHCGMS